jgi:hypothetical protein
MYELKELNDGVMLLKNNKLVTRYEIKEGKNSWKVRLIGKSYGFSIGQYINNKYSFEHILLECSNNLREICALEKEEN